MPRVLRISVVLTLPEDTFAEAKAIVDAQPIYEGIVSDMPNAIVTFSIVTPKARGAKDDDDV